MKILESTETIKEYKIGKDKDISMSVLVQHVTKIQHESNLDGDILSYGKDVSEWIYGFKFEQEGHVIKVDNGRTIIPGYLSGSFVCNKMPIWYDGNMVHLQLSDEIIAEIQSEERAERKEKERKEDEQYAKNAERSERLRDYAGEADNRANGYYGKDWRQ